ncbi:hypothetical protein BKA57DRAFT_459026 [Linnemannia elongata]|nr:hypothetical protein BKA57DRAFT_459026 [Linnemannia elongata]
MSLQPLPLSCLCAFFSILTHVSQSCSSKLTPGGKESLELNPWNKEQGTRTTHSLKMTPLSISSLPSLPCPPPCFID